MADVPDFEADEIAAAQLAVDPEIEYGELAHPALHLETHPKGPDVLGLERCLLSDNLALVPWLAVNSIGVGVHDRLPSG